MRRLYLQIYLAFIGIALLCIVVAGIASHLLRDEARSFHGMLDSAAVFLVEDLLEKDLTTPAGRAALQQELAVRAERFGLHIALWDADRKLLAASGSLPAIAEFPRLRPRWHESRHRKGFVASLPQGGWVYVGLVDHHAGALGRTLLVLALLMATMAVGCYFIARRITRRLENLQLGVDQLGSGTLSARVEVNGKDEVADLARSFNRAAGKIDTLLKQQKRVLANVSHELRSPLARLAVAVEILSGEGEIEPGRRTRLREGAARDIEELDDLIDDLLLATRLQSEARSRQFEPVALTDVLREEASRVGASVAAEPVTVQGDPRMLRRMVRNLLENARRYGGESPIEVSLQPLASDGGAGEGAQITVADRGPGVATEDRERIFEPFYRPRGHGESDEGGVGLGLSLVRQIAGYHGGAVRYLPREGGGSLFEVDLPSAGGV